MDINSVKVIKVLDAEQGLTETQVIDRNDVGTVLQEDVAPYPKDLYGQPTVDPLKAQHMLEAATGGMSTYNFPDLLRMGVQFDAFSGFNEKPQVWPMLARRVPSTKHQEEYADDEAIGLPPIVSEGENYSEVSPTIGGGRIIKNYKRGFIVSVTEEIQRFDMWGKVRELSSQTGRSMRMGRDQSTINVLTNANNYNDLNNNDLGENNSQALTLTPTNLNLALTIGATQKDAKSGQYLGVRYDTMFAGPLSERFIRMLIQSTALVRVGQGQDTAADVYGQGQNNPFFGIVNTIVIDPLIGASYQWGLIERMRAIYFQEVEGLTVLNEANNAGPRFERDVIRFRVRDWYGVGMRDDRFAFYSSSTTAPLAD